MIGKLLECKVNLGAELDDGVGGQQDEADIEEQAAHERGAHPHRVHREHQEVQADLGAALDCHHCGHASTGCQILELLR